VIGRDGSFEFTSVPTGDYVIFTSVRGYEMSRGDLTKTINDMDNVGIVLDPAAQH
jgi:hypothetical protein